MPRTRFEEIHCPVARTASVIADPWTILILREAFFGATRFGEFETALEIPKNTLADRLERLVEWEVFRREPLPPRGRRFAYHLTARGRDLLTIISAMRDWSNHWVFGEGNEPLVVVDKRTGRPIPRIRIRDEAGEVVSAANLVAKPGPGADGVIKARLESREEI